MDNRSIVEIIGKPAQLEQLAEEACELGQAALKLARVLRGENKTPVTKAKAQLDLNEEFSDVVCAARELGLKPDENIIKEKRERFFKRLEELK